MKNGTRQGSFISPYFFTVYMRCVTKDVIQTGIGCHIGNKPVCILLYADDIVILAPSWCALQCLLNVCADSITKLGMSLNVSKSVTIPYRTARHVPYSFSDFTLNGIILNTVDSSKYLGNIISARDDDNRDIMLLLRAYTTYVRPIVEHDPVVSSPYTVKDIDTVESVQRRFTKRLPGYNSLAYSERLKRANLLSLELRRLHFDLVWCYKILYFYIYLL